MHESSDMIGQELGPYRILREIGRGGTSIVYEAMHKTIGQRVAIKQLLIRLPADARRRAMREARALGVVEHAGLVRVIDCLELADGTPCLVLELLEGRLLRRQLGAPLPLATVLRVGIQLASALAAAHRHGIVHRDLKPENIMLISSEKDDERIKLLDFGLAKFLDMPEMITQTADGLRHAGTPAYIAPEQCLSEAPITDRCDVYSLGVVLYEMLCGRLPFVAEPSRLRLLHAYQTPRSPRTYRPELPPALERLIMRMLAKPPAKRPTMADVLAVLQGPLSPAHPGKRLAARGFMGATLLLLTACGAFFGYAHWYRAHSEMAWVPGGRFVMGSSDDEIARVCNWLQKRPPQECPMKQLSREQPQRQVEVPPFLIDVNEVTNQELASWLNELNDAKSLCVSHWPEKGRTRAFLAPNCHPDQPQGTLLLDSLDDYTYPGLRYDPTSKRFHAGPGLVESPAVMITWAGARLYCQRHGKDLPTEEEWEFTARGGAEQRRFPWGQYDPGCETSVFGRYEGNPLILARGDCAGYGSAPVAVGTLRPDCSRFGVRDLAGNAAEWTANEYQENYSACSSGICGDPLPPSRLEAGVSHSIRGGSWRRPIDTLRPATRGRWPKLLSEPATAAERDLQTMSDVGFRCARSLRGVPRFILKLQRYLYTKQCP